MASGYALASAKTAFCMYSRVGAAHSTGNIYNAMKDSIPLVIAVDRADTTEDGRDGHEDLEDMLEADEAVYEVALDTERRSRACRNGRPRRSRSPPRCRAARRT
jgi:thiamine pyrophosphate-dependent acetolactate synthase large subunit-like protein